MYLLSQEQETENVKKKNFQLTDHLSAKINEISTLKNVVLSEQEEKIALQKQLQAQVCLVHL